MTTALITYRVKPHELDRHLELLRAVYAELEASDAQGLRYATFQLDDAGAFVEVVMGEDLPQPCRDSRRSGATGRTSTSAARSGRSPSSPRSPRSASELDPR